MKARTGLRLRFGADDGAQTLEFALLAPAIVFMVFGIVYALLVVTANVSLSHAASVAVRYASIPTDNIVPEYPDSAQVAGRLFDSTPFFESGSCTLSLSGDPVVNAPVNLDVECPFANPLGTALNGLRGLMSAGDEAPFGNTFTISADATARRE